MSDDATPWIIVHQAGLSMEFPRQEEWVAKKKKKSGLPFPSPGNLPDVRIEPASLASPELAGRFFTTEPPGHAGHILFEVL